MLSMKAWKISSKLPIFLVSSLFLKILHFSARILPILEFYLPKLDSPFSACFIEMARVEVGDLKFDAATEHNGCKWTENFNFQQFTTTATVHLTQTLPTACWQSPPKKAWFQRERNFRYRYRRYILSCSR